jgi:hypothetical protein
LDELSQDRFGDHRGSKCRESMTLTIKAACSACRLTPSRLIDATKLEVALPNFGLCFPVFLDGNGLTITFDLQSMAIYAARDIAYLATILGGALSCPEVAVACLVNIAN